MMRIRMIVAGVVLAVLCAAGAAGGARVLALLPHPGRSHFMVFEPLLEELAVRGHKVTVVSFFPREGRRTLPNYHDISLVGIMDIFIEVIPLSMFEPSPLGLDRLNHFSMLKMLSDWAVMICEKMQSWPPLQPLYDNPHGSYDVVIVEMFNSACALGLAHATGAPVIGITSHQDLMWWTGTFGQFDNPSYVSTVLLPFSQNMTLMQRVENTATTVIQKLWFDWVCRRETHLVRERLGASTPSLCDLRRSLTLQLLNTHHSLNGRFERPPSTIEVGGMHLRTAVNATLSKDLEAIVSRAEAGVIVFSLGSMVKATTLPKERRDMFIRAFSRVPQTVLWKYEDPSSLNNLPPNVHAIPWLPQRALLNHPKVVAFIAHGGLLGMTEAVDAGVPMLVIPFFGDQPGNAAAAAAAGLATVLPYRDLTENALQEALQKVLSPEMRDSAARLSSVWRDRLAPPLDTAVYWVERAARLGPTAAAALHSPARDMPVHQLLLIDVLAVCLAALGLTLLVAFYLVRMTVCCLQGLLNRKNKEKVN